MSAPLPRPAPVDLVRGAALAIRTLAEHTDRALSVLGVCIVGDTKTSTNSNGDVAIVFPTLATVAGVVVGNVTGAGGTSVQQLQVPVWVRVSGAPAGQAYFKAWSTITGAALTSHPVRFTAIGWGVPK